MESNFLVGSRAFCIHWRHESGICSRPTRVSEGGPRSPRTCDSGDAESAIGCSMQLQRFGSTTKNNSLP